MLLLAMAATANLTFPTDAVGPASLRWWGLAIGIVGFCVMMQAWWQFKQTNVAICPTAETSALITDGIYRFTRNPMYLGFLFFLVAWAFFLSTLYGFVLCLVFVLYMNRFQIQPEERALQSLFGTTYSHYRAKVRRWL